MTNQSFDNQVKEKMRDHESMVPDDMWESIEQKKKRRRYPFFWWVTGTSLLVVGIVAMAVMAKKKTPAYAIAAKEKTFSGKHSKAKRMSDTTSNATAVEQGTYNKPRKTYSNEVTGSTIEYSEQAVSIPSAIDTNVSATAQSHEKAGGLKIVTRIDSIKYITSSKQLPHPSHSTILVKAVDNGKQKKIHEESSINSLSVMMPIHSPGEIKNNPGIDSIANLTSKNKEKQKMSFANKLLFDISGKKELLQPALPVLQFSLPVTGITDTSLQTPELIVKNIPSKRTNWSVDVSVSPFLPLRQKQVLASVNRTTNENMHVAQYKADTIKTSLQPSFAYTIAVYKKINKRLLIGAGVQYGVIKEHLDLKGKETNTNYQVVQRLANGSSGPFLQNDTIAVVTSGSRTIDAINSYRFFDIPLSIQYILVDKGGLSLRLTSGINLGLYSHYNNSIGGDLQVVYVSGITAHKQQTVIRTEFYTGFRFSRQLFKRSAVFAEPYLRFNAGKYANTVINNRPVHQAGMGVGMTFQLDGKR